MLEFATKENTAVEMNVIETTLRLRFRVTTYPVDIKRVASEDNLHQMIVSEIFPSFDESSSDHNEATPNYCKYYKAISQDNGECQFTKEVT